MKKKVLNLAIIFTILISAMVILTGCGNKEKLKEKIVHATIIIENEGQIATTEQLSNTYEELINSKAIKTAIEEKYGSVGNIQFEPVEDTDIIKVIYVCDNRADEECKILLNDWIVEFSQRMKEIYNINDIKIIDEPEITIRTVEKTH